MSKWKQISQPVVVLSIPSLPPSSSFFFFFFSFQKLEGRLSPVCGRRRGGGASTLLTVGLKGGAHGVVDRVALLVHLNSQRVVVKRVLGLGHHGLQLLLLAALGLGLALGLLGQPLGDLGLVLDVAQAAAVQRAARVNVVRLLAGLLLAHGAQHRPEAAFAARQPQQHVQRRRRRQHPGIVQVAPAEHHALQRRRQPVRGLHRRLERGHGRAARQVHAARAPARQHRQMLVLRHGCGCGREK